MMSDDRDWRRFLEHGDEDHREAMQRFWSDEPLWPSAAASTRPRRRRRRPSTLNALLHQLGRALLRIAARRR